MSSAIIGAVIIYNKRISYYDAASSSAKSSPKGLEISSIPSAGDIRLTCVPLHTTKPSRLVLSLNLKGSVGSVLPLKDVQNEAFPWIYQKQYLKKMLVHCNLPRINSMQSSSTKLSNLSYPFKTPSTSRPP